MGYYGKQNIYFKVKTMVSKKSIIFPFENSVSCCFSFIHATLLSWPQSEYGRKMDFLNIFSFLVIFNFHPCRSLEANKTTVVDITSKLIPARLIKAIDIDCVSL